MKEFSPPPHPCIRYNKYPSPHKYPKRDQDMDNKYTDIQICLPPPKIRIHDILKSPAGTDMHVCALDPKRKVHRMKDIDKKRTGGRKI